MSTILSEKKALSPWAKGGIGLGAGALLLVLVGLVKSADHIAKEMLGL